MFENSVCLRCRNQIGIDSAQRAFDLVGETMHRCANAVLANCNWLVAQPGLLCSSCVLTRTRPADDDLAARYDFFAAEAAKRRLVFELLELGLPITARISDPVNGLGFDLLSSDQQPVTTGQQNGLITLDLAESRDEHREQLRVAMAEPYRTLLGHFRHEIGHYYYLLLIGRSPFSSTARAQFEQRFGDPNADYQAALEAHYSDGAPAGWSEQFVSAYATMHPSEDWAETFAHYLHIRDTLDTAAATELSSEDVGFAYAQTHGIEFDRIIDVWLPLTWSLNAVNRSMGHADLYPFLLPPAVLGKMRFVHEIVTGDVRLS